MELSITRILRNAIVAAGCATTLGNLGIAQNSTPLTPAQSMPAEIVPPEVTRPPAATENTPDTARQRGPDGRSKTRKPKRPAEAPAPPEKLDSNEEGPALQAPNPRA